MSDYISQTITVNNYWGGVGVWDPKVSVPKVAQPDFPAANFSHDGHFGLEWGGRCTGGGGGSPPPSSYGVRPLPCPWDTSTGTRSKGMQPPPPPHMHGLVHALHPLLEAVSGLSHLYPAPLAQRDLGPRTQASPETQFGEGEKWFARGGGGGRSSPLKEGVGGWERGSRDRPIAEPLRGVPFYPILVR